MAFSPDGKLIAFSLAPDRESGKRDVFVMNADGSGHEAIVSNPADDYLLGWSPDGRWVVFASDRSGASGVWSVEIKDGRADGSPRLAQERPDARSGRLTPDGTLHYMVFEAAFDVFTVPIDPGTGKRLGAPTAVKSPLTGIRTGPDWSPDGRRLAYKSFASPEDRNRNGPRSRSSTSGRAKELHVDTGLGSPNPYMGARWSPDGQSVLLIGARSASESGIYQVGIPGGETRLLVSFPPQKVCLQAAWSRDGKSVFYVLGNNPSRLLRRDLASGADAELASMDAPVGLPRLAVSPDGKWVAFTSIERCRRPPDAHARPGVGRSRAGVFNRGRQGFRPVARLDSGRKGDLAEVLKGRPGRQRPTDGRVLGRFAGRGTVRTWSSGRSRETRPPLGRS